MVEQVLVVKCADLVRHLLKGLVVGALGLEDQRAGQASECLLLLVLCTVIKQVKADCLRKVPGTALLAKGGGVEAREGGARRAAVRSGDDLLQRAQVELLLVFVGRAPPLL